MQDDRNNPSQGPSHGHDQQDKAGQDTSDKTLTEKEEEKAGGQNKKTPGPIYDV